MKWKRMMVDFKGPHFSKVFFYVRYSVSYRDLQEIIAERGVDVDHATLNRWIVRYSPHIATQAQRRKQPTLGSWRVDETY
jgi:putative transposase